MLKRTIIVGLLLAVIVFTAAAQDDRFSVSGDLTTIYTLGNALSGDIGEGDFGQRIDTDPAIVGAFFNSQTTGTRKNGFYTAANMYVSFKPIPGLEGYMKLYAVHRPGSFYLPLQMENMNRNDFSLTLDAIYGSASIFEVFGLDLPVQLMLKGGKYKAQASQFGLISKYKTEQVLYMMNTKTDFTYELGIGFLKNFSISAATNYLFNQSVQRAFDEDGAVKHGNPVLNAYAPQFLIAFRGQKLMDMLDFEVLYGMNVSNIYSGHSAGLSARVSLDVGSNITIPIGLQFAFHEKNIDMLGQSAIPELLLWASIDSDNSRTMSFRESIGAALSAGLRLKLNIVNLDANLAGSFYMIKHYYRDPLSIMKLSLDVMATFVDNYFVGGGLIMGNLLGTSWVTRDGVTDDDYNREFGILENMGFEFYAGLNLGNNSKFVIGFNQNRGLSINNMLEARHEGQMKFKQKDTNWSTDKLAVAGGVYFKFFFRF